MSHGFTMRLKIQSSHGRTVKQNAQGKLTSLILCEEYFHVFENKNKSN